MKIKLLSITILLVLNQAAFSQSFDCYITKDTLVSKSAFEFELYIKSNEDSFLLRSVQLSFAIKSEGIPAGTLPEITYIEKSSKINKFQPGRFQTMNSESKIYFFMTSSSSVGCSESTLIKKKPVRIGKFRIESSSGNITSSNLDIKMMGQKDTIDINIPKLKMNISKWKTVDCSIPTAQNITNSGKYYTK